MILNGSAKHAPVALLHQVFGQLCSHHSLLTIVLAAGLTVTAALHVIVVPEKQGLLHPHDLRVLLSADVILHRHMPQD